MLDRWYLQIIYCFPRMKVKDLYVIVDALSRSPTESTTEDKDSKVLAVIEGTSIQY